MTTLTYSNGMATILKYLYVNILCCFILQLVFFGALDSSSLLFFFKLLSPSTIGNNGSAMGRSKPVMLRVNISCCFRFKTLNLNNKCFCNGGKSHATVLSSLKTWLINSPRLLLALLFPRHQHHQPYHSHQLLDQACQQN